MSSPRSQRRFRSAIPAIPRLPFLMVVGLGLPFLVPLIVPEAQPQTLAHRAIAPVEAEWKGVSSCSAFACHGGNGPDGDLRSAYTTWMARDPHSRAGSVLNAVLSQEIEARLTTRSGHEPRQANADSRCLGCHVRPGEGATGNLEPLVREEGVGCESCHGAAANWLEPHRSKSWKNLPISEKAARGMAPTKVLAGRAEVCARCHVGGASGDVNHDLIAAGHPRLDFEFLAYLDALPAHWDAAAERRATPGFDAKAWAVGQYATANAGLGLLVNRARVAGKARSGFGEPVTHGGVWPEFAEYSCESCHHDLSANLPVAAREANGLRSGTPRWGPWSFSMIGPIFRSDGRSKDDVDYDRLERLRRLMNEFNPRPQDVESLARDAQVGLVAPALAELSRFQFDLERVHDLLRRSTLAAALPGGHDNDHEAQVVLALSALGRALRTLGRPPGPEMNAALAAMRRLVERPDASGPTEPSPAHPARGFEDALQRYRRALAEFDTAPRPRQPEADRPAR